ncbi:MAG: S41 family peptidase, partial [Bacteroidota bacterium]
MIKKISALIVFSFFGLVLLASKNEETRLLRFPSIHEDKIVFSYAGDLYLVDSSGGMARKITSHEGYEMFPRFSPDGKHIAFTGQYDGNTEVFLIPSKGGEPKRLTYTPTLKRDDIADRMGPNNIVIGWTPDGKDIVFRSRQKSFNPFIGHLFKVSMDGGELKQLPFSEGGFCSYSPSGEKIAFNQVFREFRTWKYYKGGMADDIWLFDFSSKEIKNITENEHQDIIPMWKDDEIFFLSDRERIMNLYVYNQVSGKTEKVTNFSEYDVKFPSLGKNYIIFENGGYLFKLDTKSKKYTKVPVYISDDHKFSRNKMVDASESIRAADVSPNGERAVFNARGELFSVPTKSGVTYNLTMTPGIHERDPVWSPDGKYIAYLSDKTGEYEIYIQAHDGKSLPVQVTKNADTYKFELKWSPDSKKLLWTDRKMRLNYIDMDEQEVKLVKKSSIEVINDFNWSPDSRWITYSYTAENQVSRIEIYNLETMETLPVTSGWYNSTSPSFSNNGKYLVFTSQRNFSPSYGDIEWNYIYENMTGIYLVLLGKDTPSPFKEENDQPKIGKAGNDTEYSKENQEEKDISKINIDFEGIENRIINIPLKGGNYFNPVVVDNKLYYNDNRGGTISLYFYDFESRKEKSLGDGYYFSLSPNKKKMFVRKGNCYSVIPLPVIQVSMDEKIDISDMKIWVDYEKEWQQIFDESWRQVRDFFYVENMHGTDWNAIYKKYVVMVPYVKHRDDLSYIIGEMIGELNVGHAYINSGNDRPHAERIKTGLLGATFEKDPSGYFQIKNILKGVNWDKSLNSPFLEPGLGVK